MQNFPKELNLFAPQLPHINEQNTPLEFQSILLFGNQF
jgi:hypothetical protein